MLLQQSRGQAWPSLAGWVQVKPHRKVMPRGPEPRMNCRTRRRPGLAGSPSGTLPSFGKKILSGDDTGQVLCHVIRAACVSLSRCPLSGWWHRDLGYPCSLIGGTQRVRTGPRAPLLIQSSRSAFPWQSVYFKLWLRFQQGDKLNFSMNSSHQSHFLLAFV